MSIKIPLPPDEKLFCNVPLSSQKDIDLQNAYTAMKSNKELQRSADGGNLASAYELAFRKAKEEVLGHKSAADPLAEIHNTYRIVTMRLDIAIEQHLNKHRGSIQEFPPIVQNFMVVHVNGDSDPNGDPFPYDYFLEMPINTNNYHNTYSYLMRGNLALLEDPDPLHSERRRLITRGVLLLVFVLMFILGGNLGDMLDGNTLMYMMCAAGGICSVIFFFKLLMAIRDYKTAQKHRIKQVQETSYAFHSHALSYHRYIRLRALWLQSLGLTTEWIQPLERDLEQLLSRYDRLPSSTH